MRLDTTFSHAKQCFLLTDTRPPASPFEWRRYVVEEAIRRGEKVAVAPPKKAGRPQKHQFNKTKDPK